MVSSTKVEENIGGGIREGSDGNSIKSMDDLIEGDGDGDGGGQGTAVQLVAQWCNIVQLIAL